MIVKISVRDIYIFSKPFSVKYIGTSVKRAKVLPIVPKMWAKILGKTPEANSFKLSLMVKYNLILER